MAVGTSVQLFAYHWTIQCVGVGPLCQSPTLLQVTVETSHFSGSVGPNGERGTISIGPYGDTVQFVSVSNGPRMGASDY